VGIEEDGQLHVLREIRDGGIEIRCHPDALPVPGIRLGGLMAVIRATGRFSFVMTIVSPRHCCLDEFGEPGSSVEVADGWWTP
jgi:hypothetical protein